MHTLNCGGAHTLKLDRPAVMAIVNLTPDSFSGDGCGRETAAAIAHAHAQVEAGADILDLGAESSRPGAIPTPVDEELARLLPVVRALRDCGVPLSVDTYKPEVMRAALGEGATIINDIYALQQPGALAVVARTDCVVCLMHMQGAPLNMQLQPHYQDVAAEVSAFLASRVETARAAGIANERVWLDPGFGFGKTVAHNVALFQALPALTAQALPVLVGVSRKSMLGSLSDREVGDRMPASVVAAVLAAQKGARILRVHDVAATCDGLKIWQALG
jgi:dihydropteroate synthase